MADRSVDTAAQPAPDLDDIDKLSAYCSWTAGQDEQQRDRVALWLSNESETDTFVR